MIRDILALLLGCITACFILFAIGGAIVSATAACDSLNERGRALHYSLTGEKCR